MSDDEATADNESRPAVGAPVEPSVRPLRRGVDGVCTRSTCECAREGLGDQCVWLRPAEAEFAAQVTGEQAAMQPELALFFRDLRNYLLHVIDMSKGEHYLDVVRLNAQALIRRMELISAEPAEFECLGEPSLCTNPRGCACVPDSKTPNAKLTGTQQRG